ncbi:hypothetical protein HKCCSP123_13820 [Rhodobacterales bacterium HKCCSP123]|nr:hypothetical protein [Rhodobacterales bacterium HKCCSP123]
MRNEIVTNLRQVNMWDSLGPQWKPADAVVKKSDRIMVLSFFAIFMEREITNTNGAEAL